MFLPNEILDDIFQRVDYPTLRNARLAGRQVHEAASEVFFSRWTFDIGHSLEDCSYRMKGVANTRHLGQIRGVVASARGTLPEILPDSEVSFRQAMKRRIKQSTIDDSSKVSGFKVNREYLRILCRQYAVTYFWHLKRLLSSVAPHLEKLYIVADCDPDPDDKTRGYLANVSGSFFIKMLTSTLISVELPSLSFTRVDFHGVLCQFFPNERSLRRNTPSLSDSELHNLRSFLGSIQYIGIKVGSLHEMLPDPDAVPTVYGTVSEDNYAISLLDIKCVTSVAKKLKTIAFDYTGHDYLGYRLSDADFTGYQEKCVRNANFSTVTFLRDITRWDLNHRNIPNFVLRSIIIDNVCLRLETFMNRWQQWGWGDVFNAILNERSLQTVTDLRLSRLSYFFLVNSRYPEEMRISGWPYLRPLITSIDADLEAFQRLRDGLIERREEAGLEKDEWLSDFCMLPEVMKKISEDDAGKCVIS